MANISDSNGLTEEELKEIEELLAKLPSIIKELEQSVPKTEEKKGNK